MAMQIFKKPECYIKDNKITIVNKNQGYVRFSCGFTQKYNLQKYKYIVFGFDNDIYELGIFLYVEKIENSYMLMVQKKYACKCNFPKQLGQILNLKEKNYFYENNIIVKNDSITIKLEKTNE